MLTYNNEQVTVRKVIGVKCNKCGKDIEVQDFEMGSGITVNITGGYASNIIDGIAGDYISFDMCDLCLMVLLKSFLIPASEIFGDGSEITLHLGDF